MDERGGRKHLLHPQAGPLSLDDEVLTSDRDERRLVAFLPADAQTAAALERLLAGPGASTGPAVRGLRAITSRGPRRLRGRTWPCPR